MNRGSILTADNEVNRLIASMRPRFMNRGSLPASSRAGDSIRSFNEAPIHESGK